MKTSITFLWAMLAAGICIAKKTDKHIIHIIYTSDAHYGITRSHFRGDTNVAANKVNEAMIAEINQVSTLQLPADSGVGAGKKTRRIDYLVQGGDIANRMEQQVQSAAASWSQFSAAYIDGLKLKDYEGTPTKVLLLPGNHDISNAIGHYKIATANDATSMAYIYNLMMHPAAPATATNYHYNTEKINYSIDVAGIHIQFVHLWPDSAQRIWMQKDLDKINSQTPVVVFAHDQPECEAKHFINPHPGHAISANYKFENLCEEMYKEGDSSKSTDIEQAGWATFLKQHPNIKAYFHGNSNWNQFYTYKGPQNNVSLPVFRVDSPMKGDYSSKDETLLSFQLISIDPVKQAMTVRECLWNTQPGNQLQKIVTGASATISLKVKK